MSLEGNNIKCNVSPNSINGYREVHFTYSYNGKEYKQLVYVKDNPNFKEKDYIREAKKQFKPNYKVQAYPKARIHFPVVPVVASLAIVGGLGAGGYFTYKYFADNNVPVTETCMVNFDSDGGSYVASKSVTKGKAFDAPADPIKKVDDFSYTFDGWFLNDSKFDFTKGTTVDITLKAHWSGTIPVPPGQCIVNFDSDGGTYVASKFVTKGEPFAAPKDPTKKEGDYTYTFDGWYLGDDLFTFGTDTVNVDTTLKAHWSGTSPENYIVTFTGADCSAKRDDVAFTSDVVKEGASLTLVISPSQPTTRFELDDTITVLLNGGVPLADYYIYEPDGDNPNNYVLNIPKVTGKTEIYASTTEYCYVSYVLPDPLTKEPVKIKKGDPFGESLAPFEDENYTFFGWYYDEEFQYECVSSLKIYEDTTVYGHVIKGDVDMPLTFICKNIGAGDEASIKLTIKATSTPPLLTFFERNLKYRIITEDGSESDWKAIKDADNDDGDFEIVSTQPMSLEILQDGDTLNEGDQIQFIGNNEYGFSEFGETSIFMAFDTGESTENKFDVQGNVMSLLSGENFVTLTEIDTPYCFASLFSPSVLDLSLQDDCCNIVDASKLVLPATNLSTYCYAGMFESCTSLISTPELPAENLAQGCYSMMFRNCESLTIAPELPASQLQTDCYMAMFDGCISLLTAPELPAENLAQGCYEHMFANCESLTIAPELPATTLVEYCYMLMFESCKKLKYLKVGFGTPGSDDWPITTDGDPYYTLLWFGNAGTAGSDAEKPQFYWKGSEDVTWTRDNDHVPNFWEIISYTE